MIVLGISAFARDSAAAIIGPYSNWSLLAKMLTTPLVNMLFCGPLTKAIG